MIQKLRNKWLLTTLMAMTIALGINKPISVLSQTTVEQEQQLAEVKKIDREIVNLFNQGKFEQAIPLAKKALKIRKEILGAEHPDVAASLNNLAFMYLLQKKYSKAEPLFKEALEINKKQLGESHPSVATNLNSLAVLYQGQGRYSEAEPLFKEALEINKKQLGESHPSVANNLNDIGVFYEEQGRYSEAESFFKEALEIYKQQLGEKHPHVATSLNNLAELYQKQGRYAEAEPLFLQVLELDRNVFGKNHPLVATHSNNLALLYQDQGRYSEAESLFREALELRIKVLGENHLDVVGSLNNLALLYQAQGKYEQAETVYQQSLAILQKNLGEEHPHVATVLNNLAALYQSQGKYEQVEPLYQQSLTIRMQLLGEEHPDVATSLNNLAELYQSQGKYEQAEPLYQQSLAILQKNLGEEHPHVATSLNNLAELYQSQGKYEQAETLYQQSLAILQKNLGEEHPHVANSLSNLAALYQSQRKYYKAETLYQESLAIRKRILGEEHPDVATNLKNLGLIYYQLEDYTKATKYYKQYLEIIEKEEDSYNSNDYLSPSLFSKALSTKNKSENLKKNFYKSPKIHKYINNKNLKIHDEYISQRASNTNLKLVQIPSLNNLNYIDGILEIEEEHLRENLIFGHESQKRNFLDELYRTLNIIISLNLKLAPENHEASDLALTTILRRKGRVLDLLTNSTLSLRQNRDLKSQNLLNQLTNIRTKQSNLIFKYSKNITDTEKYEQKIAELEEENNELEEEISIHAANYKAFFRPITSKTIKHKIPANFALIELIKYQLFDDSKVSNNERLGEYRYAAYILSSKGKLQAVDLGDAEAIEEAVKSFRYYLRNKYTTEKQLKPSGQKLDALVMQPIRKLLGNTTNILISPDGVLNLIPFEALVDENNQYLLENYNFTYLTSGRDLQRISVEEDDYPLEKATILADPLFDHNEAIVSSKELSIPKIPSFNPLNKLFPRLHGTEQEAKEIFPLFNAQVFTRSKATETALKQVEQPKFLHLATHGFFLNIPNEKSNQEESYISKNPLLRSGLVFAGVNKAGSHGNDGIFSALEATMLDLRGTKLVVLSACDTGVGEVTTGEGIYGLRRAFVLAGSESQVISLWKVDDAATKELMVNYYRRLKKNEGRSLALHEVQREMLKSEDYEHPYYWASFIPSGDWSGMGQD